MKLEVRVNEEEFLAQDFYSEEVGRILTFDGSRFLTQGNNTLREVVERFRDRNVALGKPISITSIT